jgi:hypothetical protein
VSLDGSCTAYAGGGNDDMPDMTEDEVEEEDDVDVEDVALMSAGACCSCCCCCCCSCSSLALSQYDWKMDLGDASMPPQLPVDMSDTDDASTSSTEAAGGEEEEQQPLLVWLLLLRLCRDVAVSTRHTCSTGGGRGSILRREGRDVPDEVQDGASLAPASRAAVNLAFSRSGAEEEKEAGPSYSRTQSLGGGAVRLVDSTDQLLPVLPPDDDRGGSCSADDEPSSCCCCCGTMVVTRQGRKGVAAGASRE